MNKRHEVNPPKNLQIRAALPIQEINYGCANILAQTCAFRQYCWALLYVCIFTSWIGKAVKFVETSPINKAVASGNGNRFLTQTRHIQIANNPRSPKCQTEAELLSPSWPPSFSLLSTFKKYRINGTYSRRLLYSTRAFKYCSMYGALYNVYALFWRYNLFLLHSSVPVYMCIV
jgi:hypothetical protein